MAAIRRHIAGRIVNDQTRPSVTPLADRTWVALLVVLPVPLTMAFFAAHALLIGRPAEGYGLPMAYLVYGLASAAAVFGLYAVLSPEERAGVFRFDRPSARELAWALAAFVVGLGVFQLTSRVSAVLGFEMGGLSYSLAEPTTFVVVAVGAVIIAPITEEILYRGFVLGALLARGVGVVGAVALMTGVFALIHLPNFGVAGTIFISVWGLLPALLRLRFDNLSGAVVMHMLNNAFAYLLVVGLGLI